MSITVVDRPGDVRRGQWKELCAAVVETADTGKALLVPATKEEWNRMQNAVRIHVSRYHNWLSVHHQNNGNGHYFVWAEKRP